MMIYNAVDEVLYKQPVVLQWSETALPIWNSRVHYHVHRSQINLSSHIHILHM
jgi:hypothetical protein